MWILAQYLLKPWVRLLMPLFKFPVCWMVSDTQRPNEEYAGKSFEEKCQASRWIHWEYQGSPPRAALPSCRFFSLGWTHGTRDTFVEEGLGNLAWGTTQSTYGCTSPPASDGLPDFGRLPLDLFFCNHPVGPMGARRAPGQPPVSSTWRDKRGRKSLSTCRAGEGSACLWHLWRSRFHWCCQL